MTSGAPTPRVMFLTREQCHLCDLARPLLRDLCRTLDEPWAEVDVDSDPELRVEFGDQVPVVLVDSEPVCVYHIDAGAVRAALS